MDETILAFNPNASNGTDAYDTPKMGINSASIPEIYTVVVNEQLAINGMNSIPYDTEIPLGFTTGTAGTFSIKASQLVNFDSSVNIYLKDYNDLVNTPVQLTSDAVYNFSSNVTTNNTSRFALLFKSPSVTTEINPTEKNNIWISARNRQIVLETNFTGETSVSVYNAVGLKICSNNYSKSKVQLGTSFAPGVYMVSVNNSGKTITKKVIID